MLDSWRKWLQTRMNGNFQDTDRIARAIFRLEQIPGVWGFSAGMTASRLIASIAPSWPRARETSMLSLTAAAVNDSRGVLLWASEPEPTPEERATAQGRVRSLVRKQRSDGPLPGR